MNPHAPPWRHHCLYVAKLNTGSEYPQYALSEVQIAAATIISYKSPSDLNFARYSGEYGSYMPLIFPFEVYKPLLPVCTSFL